MPFFLRNPHRTWLLLLMATAVTFWVRADEGLVGLAAAAATLGIAWLKGRLVILDFMELRDAPNLWRGIIEGWLLLLAVLVFAIYRFGPEWLGGSSVPA